MGIWNHGFLGCDCLRGESVTLWKQFPVTLTIILTQQCCKNAKIWDCDHITHQFNQCIQGFAAIENLQTVSLVVVWWEICGKLWSFASICDWRISLMTQRKVRLGSYINDSHIHYTAQIVTLRLTSCLTAILKHSSRVPIRDDIY